ncbi:MAG: hypothetical protein BGN88_07500 [Clostridiales bacterium 43-6]|nr:MAG: hypothetical protein BGN88_07500 [Clostridiales bacterium 43-6]
MMIGLLAVDIVGMLVLVTGVKLLSLRKIGKNAMWSVFLSILLLPVLITMVLYVFTMTLIISIDQTKLFENILGHILTIELLILFFYVVSKCFQLPFSKGERDQNVPRHIVMTDRCIKMQYSTLLMGILVTALVVFLIAFITDGLITLKASEPFENTDRLTFLVSLVLAVMIIPLLGVPGMIISYLFTVIVVAVFTFITIQYLMVIHATIRMLILSQKARNLAVLYCILMLLPIVNTVNCILLIIAGRREIKKEGYPVGFFGIQMNRERSV